MKKAKIDFNGTRVILTSTEYGRAMSDPVWGSVHACVGTTDGKTTDKSLTVRVKWDNGAMNAYRPSDLEVYTEEKLTNNPNTAFKRAKKAAEERERSKKLATWKLGDPIFSKGKIEELERNIQVDLSTALNAAVADRETGVCGNEGFENEEAEDMWDLDDDLSDIL